MNWIQRCMLAIVLVTVACGHVEAGKFNRVLDIGDAAPDFKDLQGIDGKRYALSDYKEAKALVVVFTCNHCPVAQAYESRMKAFLKANENNAVQLVAINCSLEPADSFDNMKKHAKEHDFTFDYLSDPSQDSGRAYGATVTPHVFVLDQQRKVAYMGAFDDNFVEDRVDEHYVSDAVQAILAGKKPEVTESRQKGCSIQYQFKAAATPTPRTGTEAAAMVDLQPLEPTQFPDAIAKHKGKIVVVDYWATWCLPCLKGFRHTVGWHEKYGRKGLAVVSVSLDDPDDAGRTKALGFLRKQDAQFTNYISSVGADDAAFEAFGINDGAVPHFQLFDRNGKLIRSFANELDHPLDHAEIEAALVAALKS